MKIFFSVGEPSGDLHGGNLAQSLRRYDPSAELVGFGGPRMASAGVVLLEDLTSLAVMGVIQVLRHLPRFLGLLRLAEQFFREQRPAAVVLIDYPGFNWWVARKARKYGIPVFYYGVPQLWAWAPWRVRKVRRLVDYLLCKLPFETEWYRSHGCAARYVGHPYFDQLASEVCDQAFLQTQRAQPGPLVALLPGSRTQEVTNNLPAFLRAVRRIRAQCPQARFAIASYNERLAALARCYVADANLPIDVHVGRTSELIQASHCCLACSGSVSLELLYHTRPAVIHYRVHALAYWMSRYVLLRVRYLTLVNLLVCEDRYDVHRGPYDRRERGAERVPFPEYPTSRDESRALAEHIVSWLTDDISWASKVAQLAEWKRQLCRVGASDTAAAFIVETMSRGGCPATAGRAA